MNKRILKKTVCLLTIWVIFLTPFAYAGLYRDIPGLPSSQDMSTWNGAGWRKPEIEPPQATPTPTPTTVIETPPTPITKVPISDVFPTLDISEVYTGQKGEYIGEDVVTILEEGRVIIVNPGDNIQAAMDTAESGDRILVKPGTYENQYITLKEGVSLISEKGANETKIWNWEYPKGPILQGASNARVEGFTFESASTIIIKDVSEMIFKDNVVVTKGYPSESITLENVKGIVIKGNEIYNLYGSECLSIKGSNNTIENNIIYRDNEASPTSGRAAIHVKSGDNNKIVNVSIYNYDSKYDLYRYHFVDYHFVGSTGIKFSESGEGNLVENSIIYLRRAEGENIIIFNYGIEGNVEVRYSSVYSVNGDYGALVHPYVTQGEGMLLGIDPQFVDVKNKDFHLQRGSPAIDAGNPESPYDLEPEPNGDRINLGSYGNTPEATTSGTPTSYKTYLPLIQRSTPIEPIETTPSPDGNYLVWREKGYLVVADKSGSILGRILVEAQQTHLVDFNVTNERIYMVFNQRGNAPVSYVKFDNLNEMNHITLPVAPWDPTAIKLIAGEDKALITAIDRKTYLVDLVTGTATDAIYIPQIDRYLYFTQQRGNDLLAIYNVQTGKTYYQGVHGYGVSGIKAISPDGSYAIVASSVNTIYIVSIKDLSQQTNYIFISVPEGQLPTEHKLVEAQFINPTVAELRLQNGKRYILDISTGQVTPTYRTYLPIIIK